MFAWNAIEFEEKLLETQLSVLKIIKRIQSRKYLDRRLLSRAYEKNVPFFIKAQQND